MAKPKVLVARNIFPEWIDAIFEECEGEVWEDELPPPRTSSWRRYRASTACCAS